MVRPLMKNKVFGAFLVLTGVCAFALIVLRVVFYQFKFDPQYYPVDYGRFNFFSFFTVQSNLYVCFYLVCLGCAVLGAKRAQSIAFSPMVRLTVTTYILVTGMVYCGGIPMHMTPPLYWTDFYQSLLSVVQIVHHVVMPLLILVLFLLPPTNKKLRVRALPLVGVYPLAYSLVSIVRGAVSDPPFYPYPFYRPDFFWTMFFRDRPLQPVQAYLLMLPMLLCGIGVFVLLALVLALIHNRLCTHGKPTA